MIWGILTLSVFQTRGPKVQGYLYTSSLDTARPASYLKIE